MLTISPVVLPSRVVPVVCGGDTIAVQHGAHGVFGQKDVVAALIEFDEAITVGVADDGADQRRSVLLALELPRFTASGCFGP